MTGILQDPLDPDRDILIGEPGGEADLVWYVDFACPHTRRIRDILIRTAERFGAENVTLALRFYPGQTKDDGAEIAARAAIAAANQGRYLDMHTALFSRPPRYTRELVIELARHLDFDIPRFEADLDAPETTNRLTEDRASAERAEAQDTPIFFIDNRLYDGAWDETSIVEAIEKPIGLQLKLASADFFHWAASAGLVLILATIAALLVANIGFHDAYEHLRHTEIGLSFGEARFALSLEAWINDGLMALFFLIVGIEIKREIVNGELSDPSRAALPIMGAIGGMVVPAGIYAAINWGQPTAIGWGVPMATDIAFTLGIMALLGDRVPTSLKVFISALAIADDLGAILVIAIFYGHGFHFDALAIAALVFAVMIGLSLGRVYARLPYIILGVVLWYFIHESGLHATLAGVLTALAIPSRPSANIEGVAAQTAALFEAEMREPGEPVAERRLNRLQEALDRLREPGYHLQQSLEGWSNFLILPLFAFFNTGILIIGSSFSPMAPEALGVIAGLVIGKPLGIVLVAWIAVRLGIAQLSSEISWTQLLGAGCLAGVGFTMSIFIGSAAFEGDQLASVKLAILLASTVAAVLGVLILMRAAEERTPMPAAVPAAG